MLALGTTTRQGFSSDFNSSSLCGIGVWLTLLGTIHVTFVVQREFIDLVLCCVLSRDGFRIDSGLLGGLLEGGGGKPGARDTCNKSDVPGKHSLIGFVLRTNRATFCSLTTSLQTETLEFNERRPTHPPFGTLWVWRMEGVGVVHRRVPPKAAYKGHASASSTGFQQGLANCEWYFLLLL